MRQIPLDVRLPDHAVFESFHPGPNALAVASLLRSAEGGDPRVVWIWGPPGSGKSHLMQAGVAHAHARSRATAYLPLGDLRGAPPTLLDGLAAFDLLALDDVAAVAGDAGWERAL